MICAIAFYLMKKLVILLRSEIFQCGFGNIGNILSADNHCAKGENMKNYIMVGFFLMTSLTVNNAAADQIKDGYGTFSLPDSLLGDCLL